MFPVVLLLCFILNLEQASADEKLRDDYTFGEIENILVEYLKEKGSNLEVGTEEFNNFVMEQMDSDVDRELASREDYHLICAYLAEYLHRLSLEEAPKQNENSVAGTALFELSEEVKETTLREMKEEIQQEEAEAEAYRALNFSTMATGTISLSKARAYAEKYYNKYNPAYPRFSNDCTNFVSQILHAGGRPMKGKTTTTLVRDTKAWFVMKRPDGSFSRSTSWSTVVDLYAHLTRTQPAYSSTSKSNIIKNAKSGDVIQFKKKGADRYTHAMWIYQKSSSNLLLSGHTSNYLKRSFNAITGYSNYRIVKM